MLGAAKPESEGFSAQVHMGSNGPERRLSQAAPMCEDHARILAMVQYRRGGAAPLTLRRRRGRHRLPARRRRRHRRRSHLVDPPEVRPAPASRPGHPHLPKASREPPAPQAAVNPRRHQRPKSSRFSRDAVATLTSKKSVINLINRPCSRRDSLERTTSGMQHDYRTRSGTRGVALSSIPPAPSCRVR